MGVLLKKAYFSLILIGILTVGSPNYAQAEDRPLEIGLNLGFMTYPPEAGGSAPNDTIFAFSANLNFRLKESLILSPEITLAPGPGLEYLVLSPGVILNYSSHGFWVGAGAVYIVLDGRLSPKINAGYRVKHFVLMGYFILAEKTLMGASLGYRF